MRFFHKLPTAITPVDREDVIVRLAKGKTVLHLGCVDAGAGMLERRLSTDTWLHSRLMQVATRVVGVDIDGPGIQGLLASGISDLYVGDLEHLENAALPQIEYDLIVAGEVIEHLANFGLFLAGIRRFMSRDTRMVITTPSALRLQNFVLSLIGMEMCHPDHYCWFSPFTLERALKRTGFQMEERHVYSVPLRLYLKPKDAFGIKLANLALMIFSASTRVLVMTFWPYFAEGLIYVVTV